MTEFQIRSIAETDRQWIRAVAVEEWGSDLVVAHGERYYVSQQPGFVAEINGALVGLATFQVHGEDCELTSLVSKVEGRGIGGALINGIISAARAAGCTRLFLITTNDNLHALRFYQRRGFTLAALYPNAVTESRKIKPEIPLLGNDDIPLRDELELEMRLVAGPADERA